MNAITIDNSTLGLALSDATLFPPATEKKTATTVEAFEDGTDVVLAVRNGTWRILGRFPAPVWALLRKATVLKSPPAEWTAIALKDAAEKAAAEKAAAEAKREAERKAEREAERAEQRRRDDMFLATLKALLAQAGKK